MVVGLTASLKAVFFCTLKVEVLVAQSCPTLFDPMDCSLPDSSVHGILQAIILEWVAIPFSRDFPDPGIEAREGNGTPLQYSCLENPMDGGAW